MVFNTGCCKCRNQNQNIVVEAREPERRQNSESEPKLTSYLFFIELFDLKIVPKVRMVNCEAKPTPFPSS